MNVSEFAKKYDFKVFTDEKVAEKREIKGCYIGDLLSLAMAKVEADNVWITIQTNLNIVAVASLADASCILIADGFVPDENTIEKAQEKEIVILNTELSAYEAAKKLMECGI